MFLVIYHITFHGPTRLIFDLLWKRAEDPAERLNLLDESRVTEGDRRAAREMMDLVEREVERGGNILGYEYEGEARPEVILPLPLFLPNWFFFLPQILRGPALAARSSQTPGTGILGSAIKSHFEKQGFASLF